MFLTIGSEDLTILTGYVSALLGDLLPYILLILGVNIAMYVFKKLSN